MYFPSDYLESPFVNMEIMRQSNGNYQPRNSIRERRKMKDLFTNSGYLSILFNRSTNHSVTYR